MYFNDCKSQVFGNINNLGSGPQPFFNLPPTGPWLIYRHNEAIEALNILESRLTQLESAAAIS